MGVSPSWDLSFLNLGTVYMPHSDMSALKAYLIEWLDNVLQSSEMAQGCGGRAVTQFWIQVYSGSSVYEGKTYYTYGQLFVNTMSIKASVEFKFLPNWTQVYNACQGRIESSLTLDDLTYQISDVYYKDEEVVSPLPEFESAEAQEQYYAQQAEQMQTKRELEGQLEADKRTLAELEALDEYVNDLLGEQTIRDSWDSMYDVQFEQYKKAGFTDAQAQFLARKDANDYIAKATTQNNAKQNLRENMANTQQQIDYLDQSLKEKENEFNYNNSSASLINDDDFNKSISQQLDDCTTDNQMYDLLYAEFGDDADVSMVYDNEYNLKAVKVGVKNNLTGEWEGMTYFLDGTTAETVDESMLTVQTGDNGETYYTRPVYNGLSSDLFQKESDGGLYTINVTNEVPVPQVLVQPSEQFLQLAEGSLNINPVVQLADGSIVVNPAVSPVTINTDGIAKSLDDLYQEVASANAQTAEQRTVENTREEERVEREKVVQEALYGTNGFYTKKNKHGQTKVDRDIDAHSDLHGSDSVGTYEHPATGEIFDKKAGYYKNANTFKEHEGKVNQYYLKEGRTVVYAENVKKEDYEDFDIKLPVESEEQLTELLSDMTGEESEYEIIVLTYSLIWGFITPEQYKVKVAELNQ